MDKKFLYCYVMTYDTGFAPNPYHDVLTLATCKPTIRRCAKVGYWISGWSGVATHNKQGQIDRKGAGRLIYLAQVSEVLDFNEYWEKHPEKRPIEAYNDYPKNQKGSGCSANNSIYNNHDDCGDNIYKPDENDPSGFIQINNRHHGEAQQEHDLSGEKVLICNKFYYFGIENAIEIKTFPIPRCKKISLEDKQAKAVIDYVVKNYSLGLYPKLL